MGTARTGLLATRSRLHEVASFSPGCNRAAMRTFDITTDGKQIVFDRLRENLQVVMIDLPKQQL